MKKININSKGFTLIELLAVITIMGILMMVAIPAVSRTIENSRRDTFANLAKTYVNAVRNSLLADELTCGAGSDEIPATSAADGYYYLVIDTKDDISNTKFQQTKDLMESIGRSSWGGADVKGYVMWHKESKTDVAKGTSNTSYEYFINLVDTAKHGTQGEIAEQKLKRVSIAVSNQTQVDKPTAAGKTFTECTLS